MKKLLALLSICSACVCLLPRPALPCTAFMLDNGTAQVVGKNMDWNSDRGMLVVNKRGVQKKSLAQPPQESLTWISTYGSITFAYTREFPLGGMNEAGLVVEVTALKESTYPPEDSRTPLQASQWIQYQLDNFSTVEEVLATDAQVRIPQPDHLGLQYLVSDSSRQSAVIACIDGKTVVHAAEKLPYAVLANRPYATSLEYLGRYQGYGGHQPISWSRALVRLYGLVPTWNSQPRFVYAVDLLSAKKTSGSATPEDAFEVLAAVAQPKFSLAPTQWSVVYDVPGRSIAFKTRGNDSVRRVRLSAVDFSCSTPVKALDINAKLSGDVANSFVDYTDDMGHEMLEQLFPPLPDELIEMIAAYPETHTRCTNAPPPEDVYGYAGEPDPPGAKTISEELYEALGAAGNWIPVTKDYAHEQEAADRAQDLLDEETILEAGEPLPEEPPDDDELVRPTTDGNYLLRVAFEGGGELEFVTQGRRWMLRTMAQRIRTFPTRQNQLSLYRGMYDRLPEQWRKDLALATPDAIAADDRYAASDILALNKALAGPDISAGILADLKAGVTIPEPPGFLVDCEQEIGAGTGLDRTNCDSRPGWVCGLRTFGKTRGVINAYDWLLKPYITCVKNQAGRGTCTGFANTSAIEMLVWKTHGRRVNLSEQAYYNRARSVWEPGNFGDGHMSEVGFREMQKEGFLLYFENQWNYNPAESRTADREAQTYSDSCVDYDETCSDTTHQSGFACVEIGLYKHCGYWVPQHNPDNQGYRIGHSAQFWDADNPELSITWIRLILASGYPVILGQPVTKAWHRGGIMSGIMPYWENDTIYGGHGTHIVGFIDNDDLEALVSDGSVREDFPQGEGGGYFIVKNSWTNCWGDGGFIYVPYQAVHDYAQDVTVLFDVL